MSKRTVTDSLILNPKDFWPTPYRVAFPVVDHIAPFSTYVEPCAGDGTLVQHLAKHAVICISSTDIIPRSGTVQYANALELKYNPEVPVITNPPFRRNLLEPLLEVWIGKVPCWLLLPVDYMVNVWTNRFMRYVDQIVPIGRVSWMNNGTGGMENYAWFHFGLERSTLILERK